MSKIKIHFVCLGNAFRSRLAEAYLKSLTDEFDISSSGIAAHLFEQRLPVHAETPAKAYRIDQFLSSGQVQTTSDLLAEQDLIIFMKSDILKEAKKNYEFDERKMICWDIDDMWQALIKARVKESDSEKASQVALGVFGRIKRDIDRLLPELTRHTWIDIVDSDNQPLGFRHPISVANKKGLWHRSVHLMVVTANGQYVVEKRSLKLMMARGLLDISVGGYIDYGENPDQAAVRETNEELGLGVKHHQLKFLQLNKAASYHPHYKKYTKGFVYSYLVQLDPGQINFAPQESEISAVYLLNERQARRLIKRHYLSPFGRLNYPYKLYATSFKLAKSLD